MSNGSAIRFNRPLELKLKFCSKQQYHHRLKFAICRFRSTDDASWENDYKCSYLVFSYPQYSSHQRTVGDFFSGVKIGGHWRSIIVGDDNKMISASSEVYVYVDSSLTVQSTWKSAPGSIQNLGNLVGIGPRLLTRLDRVGVLRLRPPE